ncbi:MAG TPA: pitrilysin family protein [Thermoanaerobaculia bacterium]|nr:pitrilysin family protein [Thermoanaerobaculia bacterium]
MADEQLEPASAAMPAGLRAPAEALAAPELAAAPLLLAAPPRLDLRVRRVPGVSVVAVRVWLRGGARAEPLPGVSWATGRLLTEGTASRDWRALAATAEDRGASLVGFGGYEAHGLAVDALAADWEDALAWAADMVLASRFPADRLAWVRRQGETELESDWDQPEVRTSWAFLEQLYAPNPRARPVQGDHTGLALLDPDGCRTFHLQSLTRGVIVSVTGEIAEEPVRQRLAELFGPLLGGSAALADPAPPVGLPADRRELPSGAVDQAHLYLGHLTVPRLHPDHAALELLGVVLGAGAGLTGRIPERLREREGLAYTAQAATVAGASSEPGRLVAYVATSPRTLERAERAAREELSRMLEDGLTEEEFSEARTYLLGREPFRRESARQWADLLAEAAYWGLPLDDADWCERELLVLDRAAVEAAARRHLRPEALKVTIGLPGEEGAQG